MVYEGRTPARDRGRTRHGRRTAASPRQLEPSLDRGGCRGSPIEDLQDPARPPHPYLQGRNGPPAYPSRSARRAESPEDPLDRADIDPVDRIRPPLVGAAGRAFHGAENEHHPETLARHRAAPGAGGPLRRPERLYLHYLLLHLDRLGDPSLRYLRSAIDEEIDHRHRGRDGDAVPPGSPAVAPAVSPPTPDPRTPPDAAPPAPPEPAPPRSATANGMTSE